MRKNTTDCLNAFTKGTAYNGPRDFIYIDSGLNYRKEWLLHGNMIARLTVGADQSISLYLSTCGWNTNTTWDRLHAIANRYGVTFVREASVKHSPRNLQSETFTLTKGATK